ncbi:hypothetical protein vBPaerPs25_96 [Pseudomonas phage vB_Paer_Ps25]|uniref:Uncharacterized protein n=2 Tax=Viruses TaxID=10239 RepID=A0AAE9GR29_9CAUD|nr:hypothetical protein QE347_gp096 [Pseudomonas phage vB_Paer_Ps12]UOL47552.1 hypothetical protein vBPaerPs12_96 [Pseudomonas phage vB_Paer_Ps12]UOL47740.1 hypothetical protein vBPaerPs25_96 [Pseudomonas phage vB_Paer_Ps25]
MVQWYVGNSLLSIRKLAMTSRWKEAVYRKYSARRLRQELEEFKEARRFAPNQRIRAWFDAHIEFLERHLAIRESGQAYPDDLW